MPWTCPNCQKTFAKTRQGHICSMVAVDSLFEGKTDQLPEIYQTVLEVVKSLGPVRPTTSPKAITLYGPVNKSFLVLYPKRKWMDIWFPLSRRVDEFPVFKIQQASKNRFAHYVRLERPGDLVGQVMVWIEEAYALTQNI
ncbi:MAG: DUF5655 domain-containing protein [Bacteroidota bacterium]